MRTPPALHANGSGGYFVLSRPYSLSLLIYVEMADLYSEATNSLTYKARFVNSCPISAAWLCMKDIDVESQSLTQVCFREWNRPVTRQIRALDFERIPGTFSHRAPPRPLHIRRIASIRLLDRQANGVPTVEICKDSSVRFLPLKVSETRSGGRLTLSVSSDQSSGCGDASLRIVAGPRGGVLIRHKNRAARSRDSFARKKKKGKGRPWGRHRRGQRLRPDRNCAYFNPQD